MTIPVVPLAPRPLFGGAITMPLPVTYLDASDLRQIPDNQEVFLSSDSETSLIVEVLGLVDEGPAGSDLWEAVKYHFTSLAHDNAALSSQILSPAPPAPIPSVPQQPQYPAQSQHPQQTPPSPTSSLTSSLPSSSISSSAFQTPPPVVLQGLQRIHKFSHSASGAPRPGHESDIPDDVWIAVALWRVWAGTKRADVVCSVNVNLTSAGSTRTDTGAGNGNGNGGGLEERLKVENWWLRAVEGLRIVDFGLFGDSE